MASVEANLVCLRAIDAACSNPSPDDIRAALARLLRQPPLVRSKQLTAFLTYVVETSLAGRAATIKSYTIACDALGRDSSFDPQSDPIVRVEAGRLRRILDAYYSGDGANDPVRIELPRGRYVPAFTVNPATSAVSPQQIAGSQASVIPVVIGIAAVFGAALGLLVSDIGPMERLTLIAALLMGLHALVGGGGRRPQIEPVSAASPADSVRNCDGANGPVRVRAGAPVRRLPASGSVARR